ncbi:MAG: DNA alkylation repair protein [Nanoarchaeota archaeon]
MIYSNKSMTKQLNKLSNEDFLFDVKQFIKSSHNFYGKKNPEIKTLASRLHQEYELRSFYNVFNKLWSSNYHNERSLAIHTLEIYKEDYDKDTWRFLIPKLKEIKDFDEAERIGIIIGEMIIKYPALKREILKISNRRNVYYRKIALSSCLPLIKTKDWDFVFMIIRNRIHDRESNITEFIVFLLIELSKKNKTLVKKFIISNRNVNNNIFNITARNFDDINRIKKLNNYYNNSSIFEWLNNN